MRTDWFRSVVALGAALIAALGCAAALSDDGMSSYDFAARVFAAEAAIGVLFAVLFVIGPVGGNWARRRRALAALVALCSTLLAPMLLFLTSARAACGCGNAANGYRLPTLLGVDSYTWVVIAIVAFPILMAATTYLSDRVSLGAPLRPSPPPREITR